MNTPQILFLDEPTTGLDPQTRAHIWETVEGLRSESRMTIFLTTHYMEEAAKADYVVVMDNGRIVARGTPYQLKETYSFDHIRIKAKPDQVEALKARLEERGLMWTEGNGLIDVRLQSTLESIDILQPILQLVEGFEVVHGTMDDVFLNITGRELRE